MLSELEAGLGYTFRDKSILENALTHSSYANENRERGLRDNERLEFLGGLPVPELSGQAGGRADAHPRRSCL